MSTLEIGDTVYFQGHLSPLSNLHECSFADEDGQSYNCVEQFYFSRMASVSGETLKKEEILAEKNPYRIKDLGRKITRTGAWVPRIARAELKEGVKLKFRQSGPLREFLLSRKASKFAEATPSKDFGCGWSLHELNDKELV